MDGDANTNQAAPSVPSSPVSSVSASSVGREAKPKSQLIAWANQQDAWIQRIVQGVLQTQATLNEDSARTCFHALLRDKGLEQGAKSKPANIPDDARSSSSFAPLILLSISNPKNVNLLSQDALLTFNARMTILFGENGCGKTGYVRILKAAAGSRTAETVLCDIYQKSQPESSPPTAKIKFLDGANLLELDWRNETGLGAIRKVDVFDSPAVMLHLDEELNYTFTPGELALFPFVQSSISKVRTLLEERIRDLKPKANDLGSQFDGGTSIRTLIDGLGPGTDLAELHKLGQLSVQEQAEADRLENEVNLLRANSPAAQLQVAGGEQKFLGSLSKCLEVALQFDLSEYLQERAALVAATSRQESAATLAFAGSEVPAVLGEAWIAFIEAGEVYLQGSGLPDGYPHSDDKCLYCLQPLDEAAVQLVRKYREFCNNALREQVDRARRVVTQRTAPLNRLEIGALGASISSLNVAKGGVGPSVDAVRQFLSTLGSLRDATIAEREFEWPRREEELTDLKTRAAGRLEVLESLVSALTQESSQRTEQLRIHETTLRELNARRRLGQLLANIEDYVSRLKWVSDAEAVSRKFQGVLRSLTEASKSASETLLNEGFEGKFAQECKALNAPAVGLSFPGKQGQVARRKAITFEYRLRETLSEGEQKVIALADFIAEIRLKEASCPAVFDDPITSLDYKRIKNVADRFVKLAEERQVIVFTHNIWFVTELLSRYQGKSLSDCSYYDVSRNEQESGILTRGSHPRADSFKKLKGKINDLVQSAHKLSGEPRALLVEAGYDYLRNICEVITETDLLAGVSQRLEPNIRMTQLPNIKFGRLEDAVRAIYPIYEKCCRYTPAHSQPLETLNVRPTLEELQTDWKAVQTAHAEYVSAAAPSTDSRHPSPSASN